MRTQTMFQGISAMYSLRSRVLLSSALLVWAAVPAPGQSSGTLPDPPAIQGSPAHLAAAVGLSNGGGSTSSSAYSAEVSLTGQLFASTASSPLFRAGGGVVAVGPDLTPTVPLLAAVTPRIVRAAGGEVVTLHGVGLAPGAVPPTVRFAGQPSPQVSVDAAGTVTAVTPLLVDADGNPLGLVEVQVQTANGIASDSDAVIAGPAYLQTSPARLGGDFFLTHHATPFGLGVPSWGLALSSGAIPLPGYAGALAVYPVFQTAPAESLDSTGISSTAWPIPDLPQLVGRTLDFQSFVFESLVTFSGSFTNLVSVVIEP